MPTREELYDAADRLKNEGQLEEAIATLHLALEADADYALAHSALSVIYGKLGQHDDAIRHAIRVCELEPHEPFSFTALSVVFVRAGRIPEAEEAKARAQMLSGHRH